MKALAATLLVFSVYASRAPAAEPPPGDPLAALAWFVGGSWAAEVQRPDGTPVHVDFKCDWSDNGRALKYTVRLRSGDEGLAQYEGMYFYHPGKKRIAMVQVDRDGNVTESTLKVDGDTLDQENQATAVDGTTRPQRVRIVRKGADAFDFKAMVKRGDEWVDAVSFTYRRNRVDDAPTKP